MVQQLEARKEGNLEFKETFTSLREEVDTKTRKLNKVSDPPLWGIPHDIITRGVEINFI